MEELLAFAVTVIVISASGVMSPGPLFAANVFYGLKQGTRAGIKMSLGHTIVELPLVLLLGAGAFSLEELPQFRVIISIFGALGLFAFAGLQLRTVFQNKNTSGLSSKHGPFIAGILLSALNPFFIIWWFTIGFKLISDSLIFWSFWGVGIMFLFHIWMDFVWLGAIAFLASKGTKLFSNKNYRIFIVILSGVLVYFGFTFLVEAFF